MIIFENLERLLYIADIYRRDGNYDKTCELLIKVARELAKPIDFSQVSGIIDTEQRFSEADHPRDKKGKFTFKGGSSIKSLKIGVKERTRLNHQIATDFPGLKADREIHSYFNRNHFYRFSVIEFGRYAYHLKIKIVGNEDLIEKIRKGGKNNGD